MSRMSRLENEEPVTLLPDQALDVNLDLHPYRLMPGYRGELGQPAEAFLALYAVRENRVVAQIQTPTDLSRFVTAVHNENEALAFVQLFTARETHYFFQHNETVIEIAIVPDDAPPRVGTVAASLARRLDIKEARVRRDPDDFIIERSLVRSKSISDLRMVLRRAEAVSQETRYVWLGDEPLGELPASAIILPYYE